jgi:hypothetical protein
MELSGRFYVNLGGIAEASAFVPEMGQRRFLFPSAICHPKEI